MKQILMILVLASFATIGENQNVKNIPSLNGTWKMISKTKSPEVLIILQNDPEITMSRKSTIDGQETVNETVYFSDGRGETITVPQGTVSSVTTWNGNKLATKWSVPISFKEPNRPTKTGNIDVIQTWGLSKDGKRLTQRILSTGPHDIPPWNLLSQSETKYVYSREP